MQTPDFQNRISDPWLIGSAFRQTLVADPQIVTIKGSAVDGALPVGSHQGVLGGTPSPVTVKDDPARREPHRQCGRPEIFSGTSGLAERSSL